MINFLVVFFITVLIYAGVIIFCILHLFSFFGFPKILTSLSTLIFLILVLVLFSISFFITLYKVNKVDEELGKGADKNE